MTISNQIKGSKTRRARIIIKQRHSEKGELESGLDREVRGSGAWESMMGDFQARKLIKMTSGLLTLQINISADTKLKAVLIAWLEKVETKIRVNRK